MFEQEGNRNQIIAGIVAGGAVCALAAYFLTRSSKEPTFFENFRENVQDLFTQEESESTYWIAGITSAIFAGIGSLLLHPRSSAFIREQLSDSYDTLSQSSLDLLNSLNKKGSKLASLVGKKGSNWGHQALRITDLITQEVSEWADLLRDTAASAKEKIEELEDHPIYRHKIAQLLEWAEQLADFAENISEQVAEWAERIHRALHRLIAPNEGFFGHKKEEHSFSDLVEWATTGINLWQSMRR